MRRFFLVSLSWSLFPFALAGQAPVVTPDGDPSVLSDTIYSLAVDPADHPDQSFVYLLDDGVVRLDADARGTRTYRYVVQILTREAVETWAELSFSYTAGRDSLRVNWVRVLDLQGNVISEEAIHEQESSAPVPQQYPVYTDVKVRRLSLAGVEPGTIVDYSYTTTKLDPVLPGDFTLGWRVTTGRLTRRSRFVVDLPESMAPRIEEHNLDFPRETYERAGRRAYMWAAQDVERIEPEQFAAWPNDVDMRISVGSPMTWDSIGIWYADYIRDRFELTSAIRDTLPQIIGDATSLDDSLRAVYRWIGQDIRYVSLALGRGGYEPRTPADVFETKFGDCKDKTGLFIAVARYLGVETYPVLVDLDGIVDTTMPTIGTFDHMIAAMERADGTTYLDLTAELIPYAAVPPYLQGEAGLLVTESGESRLVAFPEDPPEANRKDITIVGELREDGSLAATYSEVREGNQQYALREAFAHTSQLTKDEYDRVALAMANGVFEGAQPDTMILFEGRDLEAETAFSVALSAPDVLERAGSNYILPLPIPTFGSPGLVNKLEAAPERRYPIDVAEVVGPVSWNWRFEVQLPEGWKADLPDAINASSDFGSYRAEYMQDGRTVTVIRHLSGFQGIEPRDRVGDLVEWLRRLGEDDVPYLFLSVPLGS